MGLGTFFFETAQGTSFLIDISARRPFSMFTTRDAAMVREMSLFEKLCDGKKCFLDIGSLYGIFSLTFTSINPNSQAYAIEPSPKCIRIMHRNLLLNPGHSIVPIQKAFGDKKGLLKMHYEWVHAIADHADHPGGSLEVETGTLDNFIHSYNISPDIIKIDVDGYEGPVLAGARDFLKAHDPLLFLELHGAWTERYGISTNTIAHQLKEMGYRVYDLELNEINDVAKAFSIFASRFVCSKNPLSLT